LQAQNRSVRQPGFDWPLVGTSLRSISSAIDPENFLGSLRNIPAASRFRRLINQKILIQRNQLAIQALAIDIGDPKGHGRLSHNWHK
jgi:hypothetical protein